MRPTMRRVMLRGQRRTKAEVVNDTQYFKKILIANRGEISCRVTETCRRLGIPTVALYSTPDMNSKHVQMADEAVHVGDAPSKDSYLRMDRILKACADLGVDAVHPGYGFLSENADFSKALAAQGVEFIGPNHKAIHAMGDKIESKLIAKKAGVNIIPGVDGEIETKEQMYEVAEMIGYPIMIKATAGGGGKGLRIAWNKAEADVEWDAAKREAAASFGDDRMLIEKFIDNPRHIEIQVIGDKHGNIVYLPERECSIQRRNQKVIEEAPSTFIDQVTRDAMGQQAAALARSVDYHTAGTVEMLIDSQRNFYFLEMNTRLQVEHPITEEITGLDLVEEMIRAARGLNLTVTQDQVKIKGWATESRVYAEDPTRNYAPSIGRLNRYIEPTGQGVRVDSGISEGSEISVYYDPMICKLITWGETREQSIERMNHALDDYVVRGVNHNIALLRDVLTSEEYQKGDIATNYLPKAYPEGFAGHVLSSEEQAKVFAVSAVMKHLNENAMTTTPSKSRTLYLTLLGEKTAAKVTCTGENAYAVDLDDVKVELSNVAWNVGGPLLKAEVSVGGAGSTRAESFQHLSSKKELKLTVQYMGTPYEVEALDETQNKVAGFMPPPKVLDTSKMLLAPMPGAVVDVLVNVGDKVNAGSELIILEAMKMQQSLLSQLDGTVKAVSVKPGDTCEDEQVLIEFE